MKPVTTPVCNTEWDCSNCGTAYPDQPTSSNVAMTSPTARPDNTRDGLSDEVNSLGVYASLTNVESTSSVAADDRGAKSIAIA